MWNDGALVRNLLLACCRMFHVKQSDRSSGRANTKHDLKDHGQKRQFSLDFWREFACRAFRVCITPGRKDASRIMLNKDKEYRLCPSGSFAPLFFFFVLVEGANASGETAFVRPHASREACAVPSRIPDEALLELANVPPLVVDAIECASHNPSSAPHPLCSQHSARSLHRDYPATHILFLTKYNKRRKVCLEKY